MSKHTPVPYYFHNGSVVSCPQVRADDNEIAFCPLGKSALTGYIIGEAEAQANARFIIRACNFHDDLLAALKDIARKCESGGFIKCGYTFAVALYEIARDARTAIAEAEEK